LGKVENKLRESWGKLRKFWGNVEKKLRNIWGKIEKYLRKS
jgi:hypothetical protein